MFVPRFSEETIPASRRTERCLETVDMSSPTSACRSQTHFSPSRRASTHEQTARMPERLEDSGLFRDVASVARHGRFPVWLFGKISISRSLVKKIRVSFRPDPAIRGGRGRREFRRVERVPHVPGRARLSCRKGVPTQVLFRIPSRRIRGVAGHGAAARDAANPAGGRIG